MRDTSEAEAWSPLGDSRHPRLALISTCKEAGELPSHGDALRPLWFHVPVQHRSPGVNDSSCRVPLAMSSECQSNALSLPVEPYGRTTRTEFWLALGGRARSLLRASGRRGCPMRLPVPLRLGRAAWQPHGGSAWKSASTWSPGGWVHRAARCTTRRGTPLKTASDLGKHLYHEALSRIGCTTWECRRGTTFRLVNQCFPPTYHEYHVFLTVHIGDAFGGDPSGSSLSSPFCSLIPLRVYLVSISWYKWYRGYINPA